MGLYGNIDPVDDQTIHKWKIYCIDKNSGEIIWQHTAHENVPKIKRHPKATHANSTPATDSLPYMQRQKYGKIVAIASITGPSTGLTGMAHYGASKSSIIGFVRTAALEFVRYNITINAISPGMVLTEGIKAILDEKRIREIEREIPMKKMADPVDVAYAALFLLTDESKYITGQSIVVDGGLTLPELPFRSIDWE